MKAIKYIKILLPFLIGCQCVYSQNKLSAKNKIIIEAFLPANDTAEALKLLVRPAKTVSFLSTESQVMMQPVKNNRVKWVLDPDSAQLVKNRDLMPEQSHSDLNYLVEPGDSICIRFDTNKNPVYTGKGAVKFQIIKRIKYISDSLVNTGNFKNLTPWRNPPESLNDFLAWNNYLNLRIKLSLPVIERSRKQLSEYAYVTLKSDLLEKLERLRLWKFTYLRRTNAPGLVNQYHLTNQDLCAIYDSTMRGPGVQWLCYGRPFVVYPYNIWDMLHNEDYRARGKFFSTNAADTTILGTDAEDPYISIYNLAKKRFKGVIKEELMAVTLGSYIGVLKEVGFTPKTEAILADYYEQPGFAAYKKVVKEFELTQRAKWNRKYTQDFSLTDKNGNVFTNQQLKGKIAVFDFWFTGCTGCKEMVPAMRKVEERFKNDTNVIFISVSIDKNKEGWLKSIEQKKYTTGSGVQLYTGNSGMNHDIIKKFFIESYPTVEVIDPNGRFLKYERKKMDPRLDSGKAMISFLQKQVSFIKDGPYVLYNGGNAVVYSLSGNELSKKQTERSNVSVLKVQTDQNTTFDVSLKSSLETEHSSFAEPEKILALSDIEGNFDSFRKLLQSNGIIDENYNWTFGKGHLVFGGDMFDRGKQVTECLWLIYSLEEKAKAAGGYVHFILGNHEIMNLQGDHRYVEQKYKTNAELIGQSLSQLYNEDSELGRWLRTKNIVEKIGGVLFLHGGISRKINWTPVTVSDINELARPNYAVKNADYGNEKTNSIMASATSPFWYRTYYNGKDDIPQIIDSTLKKFSVNHIVTGHTIVADTISVHYDHKVINTDTKHADGKSEALLIDHGNYYRVNMKGERVFLFSDKRNYYNDLSTN